MQTAETVLSVIQQRGKRGLKLERLYRQLYNPELCLSAYAKLYPNKGALTPGVTEETVDGMSMQRIDKLIDDLRHERFCWTPVRRTYILKRDKKSKRPLGLPTWKDKLLQEVMRMLLEAYYEPQFSAHSHGFRPGHGCHTALQEISHTHRGTKWFIEGDIAKCFDRLDHEVLISVLRENIKDERFVRLVENLLKAGYMEDWKWHATLSGAPQGGVLSPLLCNLYLDRLDKFVEKVLIPEYSRGKHRAHNLDYVLVNYRRLQAHKHGDWKTYAQLDKQMRHMPAVETHDPGYRRLRFVRYADDFLLSFAGPKQEAEEIKARLTTFLEQELRLELSQAKTLITHGRTEAAHFLGYEIRVQQCDSWRDSRGKRNANGGIALRVPHPVLQELCNRYMRGGKPIHRPELTIRSDYEIVVQYQVAYRGYVQYYALAQNLWQMDRLRWVMETSLLKTLASKHKSTVSKMAKRHKATIDTDSGPMRGLRVSVTRDGKKPLIAEFGGIPLKTRNRVARITDRVAWLGIGHSEIVQRLLADRCEMCGSTEQIEVHHVRKLADLNQPGRKAKPYWVQKMAAVRRKTLVVCRACHRAIHTGTTRAAWTHALD